MTVIQTFKKQLPQLALCSNNLKKYGLIEKRKGFAVQHKFIQYNHRNLITCLAFDIDENAYETLEDTNAKPNLAVFNSKHRDRAHFIYLLKNPVSRGENSRQKPLQFLNALKMSMTATLNADPCFTHFIIKTPGHPAHLTYQIHNNTWDLNHLSDFFDLSKRPEKPKIEPNENGQFEINGRNDNTFDKLRRIAYRYVQRYKNDNDDRAFREFLYSEAKRINTEYADPLPGREIETITNSVCSWTWTRYKHKGTNSVQRGRDAAVNRFLSTEERQILSAAKTNEKRRETTQDKLNKAVRRLVAQERKITQRAVAELSALGIATVKRHWKDLIQK